MGCANSNGGENGLGGTGGSGSSGGGVTYIGTKAPGTALAVGDIVFNDGSATPYSKIDERTEKECTKEEKAAAIAVIFRVGDGTEGNKTLGVGIKHEYLKWCKDSNVNGYNVKFTDTVVNFNGVAGSLTFTGKTDGNKNLMIMARTKRSGNYENDRRDWWRHNRLKYNALFKASARSRTKAGTPHFNREKRILRWKNTLTKRR